MTNPLARPLDISGPTPKNAALKRRINETWWTGRLTSLEVNYLLKHVHGDNQAMTFDDLPERAQQLILKAEAQA